MADFTKVAIMDTFLSLLNDKPFNKITIKEIVTKCGINRNTFYYHFTDIYDLLEKTFDYKLNSLNLGEIDPNHYHELINTFVRNVAKQKECAMHIYNSVDIRILAATIHHVIFSALANYFSPTFKKLHVTKSNQEFILTSLTDLIIGVGLEWASKNFDEQFVENYIKTFINYLDTVNKILHVNR